MNHLISVIIPIYNVEKYLEKCINSVINQSYNDLEIILVDDGSKDRCGEICEEYKIKDSRIKVIHKENGGLSDARNAGIRVAKGDYIAFLDSDDFIHIDFYKVLMSLMSEYDADIAQCELLRVNEDEIFNVSNNSDNEVIDVLSNTEALINLHNEKCVNSVVVWNKVYKRELFEGILFPVGKIHEDQFTTYKVLFKANKVATTSKQMYYYLQRSGSIMGTSFNVKRLDALEACKEKIDFYKKNSLFNIEKMARKNFEDLIRDYLIMTANSKSVKMRQTYNDIIIYYRKNKDMFLPITEICLKKRILRFIYLYVHRLFIKFMYKLNNYLKF